MWKKTACVALIRATLDFSKRHPLEKKSLKHKAFNPTQRKFRSKTQLSTFNHIISSFFAFKIQVQSVSWYFGYKLKEQIYQHFRRKKDKWLDLSFLQHTEGYCKDDYIVVFGYCKLWVLVIVSSTQKKSKEKVILIGGTQNIINQKAKQCIYYKNSFFSKTKSEWKNCQNTP